MPEEVVEFGIEIENLEEVQGRMKNFSRQLEFRLYDSLLLTAEREEKILKSTPGFRDVTGHLRRSLYVTAVLNPIGIEMGSFASYAAYTAYPHGTWSGGWWDEYISGAVPRILDSIDRAVERLSREFNEEGEG